MGTKFGLDCKVYRNTGTYSTPVWVEIKTVKDMTKNLEKGEGDFSTRGTGGWEAIRGALKKGTFDWESVYDTQDPNFTALEDSFWLSTALDLAFVDGDIAVAGTKGLRCYCEVMKFSEKEPLDGPKTVDVSAKPTYVTDSTTHLPIGPVRWTSV